MYPFTQNPNHQNLKLADESSWALSLIALKFFNFATREEKCSQKNIHAQTLLKILSGLKSGHLSLTLPNGETMEFGNRTYPMQADIQIHDWSVFKEVMSHGDIGFAESYGLWNTSDLRAILKLAILNRTNLERAIYGSWLGSIVYRLRHWLRDNSKSGSRKNIHAHYDLGNAFYSLWLDPTMSYSSAWFSEGDKQSLAQAKRAKIQRILDSLKTKPGDHLLEIGCGWGGVMEESLLSQRFITGLALSTEQKAYAESRLSKIQSSSNSSASFEVRLQDYRDCQEQFDGIASVEMFEAVGEKHWLEYF